MLVIVRNEASLDGVAHRLPAFIILIIDVPPLYAGVFVDHKHGTGIERKALTTRLIAIQQSADGIAQPVGCLIPAMGQQCI